jgi:hypothetical protein
MDLLNCKYCGRNYILQNQVVGMQVCFLCDLQLKSYQIQCKIYEVQEKMLQCLEKLNIVTVPPQNPGRSN